MLTLVKINRFAWMRFWLVSGMLITLIGLGIYLNTVVQKGKLSNAIPLVSRNLRLDRSNLYAQPNQIFALSR